MKRIYENIPVQSLLNHVKGSDRVKIIDCDDSVYETNPRVLFDDCLSKLNTSHKDYYRINFASVKHVRATGTDSLEIVICTAYEEY